MLIGTYLQVDRDSCPHLATGPHDLRRRHWAGSQKAKHLREIWWNLPRGSRPNRRVFGGEDDSEPPQFQLCGTLRTRRAAARRRLMVMEPTWSPTRCHYGPDGRDAAVLGTCGGHVLARSGRQTSTALEPARPQNVASSASGHAGTEAMLLRPAAVVGLKSTLHEGPPRPDEPRRGPQIVASIDNGCGVETGPA